MNPPRAWNRAKLLWGYLARRATLGALPVEYIVETTAKCNLYCPMCPRETHPQPKADMTDEVFESLVREAKLLPEEVRQTVLAHDGQVDSLDCGTGDHDVAWVRSDEHDNVVNCELVKTVTVGS